LEDVEMPTPESVALISAGYPPIMAGGIDVQTYDLAHALSSMNVNVTVLCGGSKTPKRIQENPNLTILRLPMVNVPPRVVGFQLQNLGIFRKTLPNYDIIHSQHSSGSIYGFLKQSIKKPWVVSFHDHQLTRLKMLFEVKPWKLSVGDLAYYTVGYSIFEVLTRIELKWADHYIACGLTGFQDYFRFSKINPAKTTLIRNGIDLDKINTILDHAKQNEDLETKGYQIFTCGRLYASKGTEYLIRAVPQVLKTHRNVVLKIFGKGPLQPRFENLISSLNLRDHVRLEGHVPYETLVHEMNKSDIAVFPSLIEVGASLAVMEAMACRKAVVAFDYPFSKEIIKHNENGYLVPAKKVNALSSGISVLLSDAKLRRRLGENAHQSIVKNHDAKHVVRKYLEVYSRMLSIYN
jgi:glycosyltransferase involved in cell wall biosynthesis